MLFFLVHRCDVVVLVIEKVGVVEFDRAVYDLPVKERLVRGRHNVLELFMLANGPDDDGKRAERPHRECCSQ